MHLAFSMFCIERQTAPLRHSLFCCLDVGRFIPGSAKCGRLSRFRFYGYPCSFRFL